MALGVVTSKGHDRVLKPDLKPGEVVEIGNIEMARDYASKSGMANCPGLKQPSIRETTLYALGELRRRLKLRQRRCSDIWGWSIRGSTTLARRCRSVEDKLPNYLREMLPEMRKLLTESASMRGPAFYGSRKRVDPSRQGFRQRPVDGGFNKVQKTVKACMRFLEF
ncbi:MAG: hypothetical protein RMH74_08570 [Candidatus Caldarchaeum sp.]|nr:hypothetical protein [Candidatus Caldarchaeum sp.]